MPRFVILRHEFSQSQQRDTHWDLMLEQQGALRTWALASEPDAETEIAAEALPDHRLAYLAYEGPVSGNRGSVTRWDAGEYEPLVDLPDEVLVKFRGTRLNGSGSLRRPPEHAQRWMFTFSG